MDFLQVLDVSVRPGGLVEWTPSLTETAALTSDPRPTSHNHERHLREAIAYQAETGHIGGRESWLGVAIEFEEPLSIPAIRAALTAWIDRHEVLRSHVVCQRDDDGHVEGGELRRYSAPPGSVMLKMSRVGWYHDSTLLVEQIAGWFDRSTAPVRWPAYCFATVGREDSFTLLFAGDHSLLDGYSLIMLIPELRALYHTAVANFGRRTRLDRVRPLTPDATVGSYVDFSAVERRAADEADVDHPAVQAWGTFLAEGMPRYPALPPRPVDDLRRSKPPIVTDPSDHAHGFAVGGHDGGSSDSTEPQRSLYAVLADDETTNEFTAVCAEAGTTLFPGVMAALALVSFERTGVPRFRAVLPRHTRHELPWQVALGWFVSLSPFDLDLTGVTTFAQLAIRASAELRRGRIAASLPLLRVTEILGANDSPRFVVSFLDTRASPEAIDDDAGAARVLRSHRYADDEVYLWINRTPSGLRLSARYPQSLDDDFREYCAAIATVIADVAARKK